jgi:hypothetical protein
MLRYLTGPKICLPAGMILGDGSGHVDANGIRVYNVVTKVMEDAMTLECSSVPEVSSPPTDRVDCPYCYRPFTRADADKDGVIHCECGGDLDTVNMKAIWTH